MSDRPLEIPELPLTGPGRERDGIGEDDHAVPRWFNWSWIASWIFGIAYMAWYLVFSDWSSAGQWRTEVAAAESRAAAVHASLPTANPKRGDPAEIAEGAKTFATICAACHMPDGHGLVGPSLVDPYWKYGSSDADLFTTVSAGRPGGMPPWGPQLGTDKIWEVLAYIETLPKTTEPGFGAPGYVPPAPPASPPGP
jgi:cytochrome c oxidase cbb3-type subunit 3